MTPEKTVQLIEAAGGDLAFADLLGLEVRPGLQQRINNWKHRGLPKAIMVEHYDLIRSLQADTQGARP